MPDDNDNDIPDLDHTPAPPDELLHRSIAADAEHRALEDQIEALTARLDALLGEQPEALRLFHEYERFACRESTAAAEVAWRLGWVMGQAGAYASSEVK